MNSEIYKSKLGHDLKKFNYKDLIIFLIPFIIFMGYLYVFNPGILSYDSYNQLYQIATSHYSNWHPFFHTFIEMLCLKIYPSPISVGILQIIVFSLMWTIICNYVRNNQKNKNLVSDNQFIFQVIITVFLSVIPLNPFYSITLWKDILFSYCILFLCFLVYVMLENHGDVDNFFVLILSLTMAFTCQLRLNGYFTVVILLILFVIYFYKKDTVWKLHILIPAVTIIFILLIASLNIVYEVEDSHHGALIDCVSHMLVDYDLEIGLDPVDKEKLYQLVDEKYAHSKYKITHKDSSVSKKNVWEKDKSTYIGMAIGYSLKNPLHFVQYLFKSAPMVWDITRDDDWKGLVYSTNINNAKAGFYKSTGLAPITDYTNASAKNLGTPEYDALTSYVLLFKENDLLNTLFINPAFYMYLAFIIMAGIYILTRSKNILFVYLPNMLNIVAIFLTTPAQDIRFLYPNFLVFYFLMILLVANFTKVGSKNESKKGLSQNSIMNRLTKDDSSLNEHYDSNKRIVHHPYEIRNDNAVFDETQANMMDGTNIQSSSMSKSGLTMPKDMEDKIIAEIMQELEKQNLNNEDD